MTAVIKENSLQTEFSKHGRIYPFTTERLDQYLPLLSLSERPVFTVCGSGDHLLNSILLGVRDISAFDINVRALWWSELKVSALRRLTFDEFTTFFLPSLETSKIDILFNQETYNRIRIGLSLPARHFFDTLFLRELCDTEYVLNSFFTTRRFSHQHAVRSNLYLVNAHHFNELKKNLKKATLRYLHLDVLCATSSLLSQKATILLSNVADYPSTIGVSSKGSFSAFLKSVVLPFCEKQRYRGRIAAAYLYDVESTSRDKYHSEIDNPLIRKRECSRLLSNYQEIQFTGMEEGTLDSILVHEYGKV
jgi:hypothetical protein